ncbi:hypothetical protein B5J92_02230 [Moraxella atlantae]|nr:hypothetical protein B5J92_02230 [Moraxella atlantae]
MIGRKAHSFLFGFLHFVLVDFASYTPKKPCDSLTICHQTALNLLQYTFKIRDLATISKGKRI